MIKTLREPDGVRRTEGLITADPTATVKPVKVRDTGGLETWAAQRIEQYRARPSLARARDWRWGGSSGTMQRRSDAVKLGPQPVSRTEFFHCIGRKSSAPTSIYPVLPELQAAIDAMPKGGHLGVPDDRARQAIHCRLASATGSARGVCQPAAPARNPSAHGLRKAGATRLADHGCTDHEIMAWGGWRTLSRRCSATPRRPTANGWRSKRPVKLESRNESG